MPHPAIAERPTLAAACPLLGGLIDLVFDGEERAGAFRTGVEAISLDDALGDLRAAARPGRLDDITITGRPNAGAILSRLRRWGAALMPSLIPADMLRTLEAEFEGMIAARHELAASRVDEAPASICLRLEPAGLARALLTSALFASPVMRAIADAYFDDAPYAFNHTLFVHKTGPNAAPPSGELHYDVTRMLKFWVYLNDATVANGAMRCVPGSNLWLRLVRRDYSERRTPKGDIPNRVEGLEEHAVHLVGPPGTMFIFDTDMAHGASPVLAGGERRIMRAHCTEELLIERARTRG